MTVNVELFKGKRLADGSHPVMVRICAGRRMRRVSTGVAARQSAWNARKRRVSARDPRHEEKNRRIALLLARALSDPSSFLPYGATHSPQAPDFLDMIRAKAEECLRLNTRRGYGQLLRFMQRHYGDRIPACTIDAAFAAGFRNLLLQEKRDAPAMGAKLAMHFSSVCSFAHARGWLTARPVPIVLPQTLRHSDRNLLPGETEAMLTDCRDMVRADPQLRTRPTLAIALFTLCFAFQGLAPVDLAALRIADLRVDAEAVEINTRRRKTGRQLHIVADAPSLLPILTPLMAGKSPADYLIDCFSPCRPLSERQQAWRLSNYFHALSRHLPRPGGRRITFYYARHAFCNAVEELDVPRHMIRKLVGHAPAVLERSYLRPPSRPELLALSRLLLAPLRP